MSQVVEILGGERMSDTHIAAPVTKVVSAWGAVGLTSWAEQAMGAIGITSWSEAASFLAFCYTLVLLSEWFWKKLWRPLLEKRGYLRPKLTRRKK
jgi:hypothetical protein